MKNNDPLQLLLEQFSQATDLPIHIFDGNSLSLSFRKNIQDYNLPLYIVSSLSKELPPVWTSNTPEFIYFGGLHMKKNNLLLFIGPIFTAECSISQSKKILERLGPTQRRDVGTFRQQLNILPRCDVRHLKSYLLFLNHLINNETYCDIPHIDFHWSDFFNTPSPVILSISDSQTDASDFYFSEETLLSIIRHGKVKELADFFNVQLTANVDTSHIEDIQQLRNYLIGANTLLSRVGKSAGLDYNFINTSGDYYLEQLTNATAVADLHYIFYQICLHYTKEIAKLQKFQCASQLAQKVNSYIQSHLYDKMSTSLIADALNFSESYVCAEFKKATGITLTAYVQTCKINEAKYLLEQHSLSPSEISTLLGYSSPSYFGVVFKKETSLTPGEWLPHINAQIT